MSELNSDNVRVQIRDLTLGYPGQVLFENLNLKLSEGELVCFMGPNGAGKSTLIRTMAGLQKATFGEVNFMGQHSGKPKPIYANVALVLTDPVKNLDFNVAEVVTFGRYPYLGWNLRIGAGDQQHIDDAISKVNIDHLREKKMRQLSDGQIQMVMIARAIAQDTPVIILDEPTAHLDLNNRVEIMRLLHKLARDGKAILIATHELDLALQTADRIWLTGNSRNIITGIPEDLVLNNQFDEIFKFKGFDLKTGKVQHKPFRNIQIQINGHDHVFLWTKNALERNGYSVTGERVSLSLEVNVIGQEIKWILNKAHEFPSIASLLNFLQNFIR